MNLTGLLFAGFTLGTVLGLAYFAGLWFTVRRLPVSANPRGLMRRSRSLRQLLALAIIMLAIRYDAALFWGIMPGFVFGRILVSRRVCQPQVLCKRAIPLPHLAESRSKT